MVVESAPQSRRCYAETLLHVIDFLGAQSVPLPHLAAGFGEARSLKRRGVQQKSWVRIEEIE
jgi:hypothetical protein